MICNTPLTIDAEARRFIDRSIQISKTSCTELLPGETLTMLTPEIWKRFDELHLSDDIIEEVIDRMKHVPPEDRLNMTRDFAQNQIAILMGGRVAEEIVFGQKTTGAGNDIERATELARSMVTEWGMSDEFGPLNFSGGKHEVFLGRDFSSSDRLSEDTAKRIDAEIRDIVFKQHERAVSILTEHRKELEAVGEALLEYETLDGDDIDTLLRGGKLSRPVAAASKKKPAEAEGEDARGKRPSILPPLGPGVKKDPSPEPA